ncbi:hypothetical protein CAPTEDRAFT_201778 [Capitella teleta]|uniref:Receptor ligand binding region domain-containing protein n=1 Tax=Capitella teleta TaxID=283909 RepID=R7U526_CAPTE|nr:hypothetical protein CAPTEDRAFT_201778 [Capitella teleta]|eukprot:ELU01069.1 hypothetical protein CAPTEDRAFT_201778 [Capitella teleta]
MADISGSAIDNLSKRITEKLKEPPWNMTNQKPQHIKSIFGLFLYDAAYLNFLVLNATLAEGENFRDGRKMMEKARHMNFRGLTGEVQMDNLGDREPNYWVYRYDQDLGKMNHYMKIYMSQPEGKRDQIIVNICVVVLCIVVIASVAASTLRRRRDERELNMMLWRVNYTDIEFSKIAHGSSMIASSRSIAQDESMVFSARGCGSSVHSLSQTMSRMEDQVFIKVGIIKGINVAVTSVSKESGVVLLHEDLVELKRVDSLL